MKRTDRKPYQKQTEGNYEHILTEEGTLVLGLPKGTQADEAELYVDMDIEYSDINLSLLQLNASERELILFSIEESIESTPRKIFFNLLYWEIICDFILTYYGDTLFHIAGHVAKRSPHEEQKLVYDRFQKLKNIKRKPSEETLANIKTALDIYKISEDILETGKGTILIKIEEGILKVPLKIACIDKCVEPQTKDFLDILIKQAKKRNK
ncbi:hypothetical protein D3Z55_20675 [Clostridiaceae bacterium]|nr:hypothetical protein [Clostridiaceae bacterium]